MFKYRIQASSKENQKGGYMWHKSRWLIFLGTKWNKLFKQVKLDESDKEEEEDQEEDDNIDDPHEEGDTKV